MNWLKKDALNRAWRVIYQTMIAVVVIPAGDAALQVIKLALADAATGQGFDWGRVGESAMWSAGVGVTISVIAYWHRLKLDPSRLPSLEPPTPPSASRGMAQR